MTDAYVTQLPTLGLQDGVPAANVTQLPALALYEIAVPARITQLPVLALYGDAPCVRQVAQCWRITRTDDTVLGFTTHDAPIVALGTTFESCDSLRGSAAAYSSNAEQVGPGDIEMTGVISSEGITEADLYGGLYDGARVEVFEIAWDGSGAYTLITAGVVSRVTHGGAGYTVSVQTGAAKFTQQPLITTYTPACRHVFGDASCSIALGPLTVTGSATTIYVRDGVNRTSFRRFADSTRTEAAGYFDSGVITWTSGDNTGIRSEVKSFDGTAFELWDVLPNEIAAGDAYSLTPGCPKTVVACQTLWGSSNIANFGGFPHLPGKDVLYQTPDSTS
jgi:uncharacterized phage protein (TIGR02218 family)